MVELIGWKDRLVLDLEIYDLEVLWLCQLVELKWTALVLILRRSYIFLLNPLL